MVAQQYTGNQERQEIDRWQKLVVPPGPGVPVAPVMDQPIGAILQAHLPEAEEILERIFDAVPVDAISSLERLEALHDEAITCQGQEAFRAMLAK